MRFRIIHTTSYIYHESIGLCHNIARLIPRSTEKQECIQTVININPEPGVLSEYEDFFGNRLIYFAIQREHKQLTVTVCSEVEKKDSPTIEMDLYSHTSWEMVKDQLFELSNESIAARQFIPETAMTASTPEIQDYAKASFSPGRPLYDAAFDLMQRIFRDFEFKPGFTTVTIPASEIVRQRKGVCQDFAHVAIACLRSLGLPARYVSGYIETISPAGTEKLVGVDASHAWFSVFVPGLGWVDFDPTNNQIPADQHIVIGWGRDYSDISPVRGVISSSGPHELSVAVDVSRIDV